MNPRPALSTRYTDASPAPEQRQLAADLPQNNPCPAARCSRSIIKVYWKHFCALPRSNSFPSFSSNRRERHSSSFPSSSAPIAGRFHEHLHFLKIPNRPCRIVAGLSSQRTPIREGNLVVAAQNTALYPRAQACWVKKAHHVRCGSFTGIKYSWSWRFKFIVYLSTPTPSNLHRLGL